METEPGLIHVLVIDDDPDLRELMTTSLLGEGHQVVATGSAEEGLEQLPFYRFDVAFVDHHLPGIEGLVFGEYLLRNNPEMAIALVTGASDERVARMCHEHGIALIEKPFELDALTSLVERYRLTADARRARAEAEADPEWAPPIARHWHTLADFYSAPGVPQRLQDLLAQRVRTALANLRLHRDDAGRDRVAALAGLLACQALGVRLPRNRAGQTAEEEYDALMRERGWRLEFSEDQEA